MYATCALADQENDGSSHRILLDQLERFLLLGVLGLNATELFIEPKSEAFKLVLRIPKKII